MGARQSKRSVDITTTPKKEGVPVEGVVGDAAAPGDGKLEKIEETDAKPTTNGVAPHTDATPEDKDKDKDKDEATEKENEKEDETKAEDAKVESPTTETPAEGAVEVTTPTEGTPASPTTATSPDSKETKKKPKKKWSFRSISFGKKDKSKPAREDAPKNGDVTKEEPLAEGGEEVETPELAEPCSPADDKSAISSPTEKEQSGDAAETTPEPAKPEDKQTPTMASSPVNEKKDDATTPSANAVIVEAKKCEDNEKQVEPANADNKVEVSQVRAVIDAPVEVNSLSKQKSTTVTTAPSIIERKTSEDFPSQFPSSPPPTPIDPSPLQQAQQVAANATALAEALKLPAEAANKANIAYASGHNAPGNMTSFSNSNSNWQSETSMNKPFNQITEKSELPVTSVSPEQTGNAYPLPIVATKVVAVTDNIAEKITFTNENHEERANENVVENDVHATMPERVEIPVRTIDSEKSRENDLVIQTEEGPIPVSSDIIVAAKPAHVVPDSPVEDSKIVQVLLEVDDKRENLESITKNVESSDSLLVVSDEKTELPKSIDIIETVSEPIVSVPETETRDEEINEKDVPPPLPDSPIPVPKVTSQLLNFITTQIEDTPIIGELIDVTKNLALSPNDPPACLLSTEIEDSSIIMEMPDNTKNLAVAPRETVPCSLSSPQTIDRSETSDDIVEIEETGESHSRADDQRDKSLPTPDKVSRSRLDLLTQAIDDEADLPQRATQNIERATESLISHETNVCSMENPIDSIITNDSPIPVASIPEISTETTTTTTLLLTPPASPSNVTNGNHDETTTTDSTSQLEIVDDQSNREFKMESVEQSLNSYNDSELELKERLAESMEENTIVNCELTNAIEENDQSKTEPEAPVENNIVANDISTTDVNDDAPMSPPPAVPAEAPAPTLGPAITEDVASVTKAIEEIDINEKAVAAAVNENIESINTNEIIADMNHQNKMIE